MTLKIYEIFYSLQGETTRSGLPTVFVRLSGCPLRCQYCDTDYAFSGGELMSEDAILAAVAEYNTPYVTVTGGEPLAQKGCYALLTTLCNRGYDVSLETSGAMDIADVDQRVSIILDIKTPASKEEDKNRWQNLAHLQPKDEIKFVICNRNDYDWAKEKSKALPEQLQSVVLFSPSYHELPASELAEWILADQLSVRMQVQLHKTLWGEKSGV